MTSNRLKTTGLCIVYCYGNLNTWIFQNYSNFIYSTNIYSKTIDFQHFLVANMSSSNALEFQYFGQIANEYINLRLKFKILNYKYSDKNTEIM